MAYQCNETGCTANAQLYRQCADNKCKKEIGYCKAHGGDDRAIEEMGAHMAEHDKDTQS